MPSSSHPQAKFDPIPPDLELNTLVDKTSNFDYAIRIPVDQITNTAELEHLVLMHVIIGGRPLVLEGWNNKLPPWLFSSEWLMDNVGKKEENVRDIPNAVNIPMTTGHYLKSMDKLTKQWSPSNFRDPRRQRLYLKDIDCPVAWYQHLQEIIPETLFYLNDSVGETGGPGAAHERNMYNQTVVGKGIAPAGDLMSNLPEEMRAENMMCYIGHEGTYTPAHREMCATLGQNIMVETSTSANGEQPGSSIWFMTESKDREVVSEYFLSMLGQDIEVENHFAQINAWKKAPFPVYIVEQKVGDFILIPPLAPHQVWNRGTRTMKAAWNRTTVETLELALREALPRARMVCRDEQYKCKAIVYYSLLRYYDQLKRVERAEEGSLQGHSLLQLRNSMPVRQLQKDFKRLFTLYTEILVTEMFSPGLPKEKAVEFIPFDSNITCSYCRCNIFNRFLTCKTCVGELENGEPDTYDICMECYAMGRSCTCMSNLKWVEQWQWSVLIQRHEQWRAMIISNDGYVDVNLSPQCLEVSRTRYDKKSVAQICQEQLKLRPWQDPNAEVTAISPRAIMELESPEPEVDDEGRVKKKRSQRRKSGQQKGGAFANCHICSHADDKWKLAFCTTCTSAYCYGTLWRAFDLKPQTVMEQADWQCPKCLGVCGCGQCRRKDKERAKNQKEPYRPKGTLLGHDTRKVADPRSVESLVDFRRTNLTWLRGEGDHDPKSSMRMKKLVQEALQEKARDEILEEELMPNGSGVQQDSPDPYQTVHMAIDPLLWEHGLSSMGEHHLNSSHRTTTSEHPERFTSNKLFAFDAEGGHFDSSRDVNSNYSHGGYLAPSDTMVAPGSSLPDTSGLGLDRGMGMGYFQQANDTDRILFDHPDSVSTPTASSSDRLIPGVPYTSRPFGTNNRKRKADSLLLIDDEYSKKQKLVQGKRDGIAIMTKNNLDGGNPLIVKLPLKRSKEFLQRLEDLDIGTEDFRRNLRPYRPINQKEFIKSSYCEMSDEEDDGGGMFVPEQPVHPARIPSTRPKSRTEANASVQSPKSRHPSKIQSTPARPEAAGLGNQRGPPQLSNSSQLPNLKKGLTAQPPSSLTKSQTVEDASLSSPAPSPPANVDKRPRGRPPKTLTSRQNPATLSHASPQDVPTVAMSPQESTAPLPSSPVEEQHPGRMPQSPPTIAAGLGEKSRNTSRRVTFQEPIETSESDFNSSYESEDEAGGPVQGKNGTSVDKYYEKLKMEALQELEIEEVRKKAQKAKKVTPKAKSVQKTVPLRTQVKISGRLGSIIPGSLQHERHLNEGKELSLAERRALEGKTTKIVGKKPSPAQTSPATRPPASKTRTASASESAPAMAPNAINSMKSTPGPSKSFDSSYSGISTSEDDDDDDSIPAHRPASFYNSTENPKPKPAGMLDGMRRGGMFSGVR